MEFDENNSGDIGVSTERERDFSNILNAESLCLRCRHHGTEENDGEIGSGKNSFRVEENDR